MVIDVYIILAYLFIILFIMAEYLKRKTEQDSFLIKSSFEYAIVFFIFILFGWVIIPVLIIIFIINEIINFFIKKEKGEENGKQ